MFKAVITTHNLKQIETDPVTVEVITKPTMVELDVGVIDDIDCWENSEHSGTSLSISITEV